MSSFPSRDGLLACLVLLTLGMACFAEDAPPSAFHPEGDALPGKNRS